MRKHGWQLPYHPLQVVAIAVFLALAFAFYVFFVPFVGSKQIQNVVMGLYTPLAAIVFYLYVSCAGINPVDLGDFKSRRCPNLKDQRQNSQSGDKPDEVENGKASGVFSFIASLCRCPLFFMNGHGDSKENSSEHHVSEDGVFYCNLCEVEVGKHSKHCRVCDKCVDSFDHHCRWVNNCIGKRNYRSFFFLMISAIILLIVQWSTGIVVTILCLLDHKRFSTEVELKLGSSFSLAPFVVVVVLCTSLAVIATLPIAQLFFFHILLIKKGISTYDYIIALREQEQVIIGQQSPQMSPASSLTVLSTASSFRSLHRAAWCTPPRLFLEDQFVVASSTKQRNPSGVKINPWTLSRLSTEQVTNAATQARKKSRILIPVSRNRSVTGDLAPLQMEARSAFRTNRHVSSYSPDSSLGSPDLQSLRVSSSGAEDSRRLEPSRSASDGYDASGGEDSDRIPVRIVHRSSNWSNVIANAKLKATSSQI